MTKEVFLEKLFSIYPKGNPATTFSEYNYTIMTKKTFLGDKITDELIITKFTEYIQSCKDKGTQEQYIKSLDSWLKSNDFNTNYRPIAVRKTSIRRTKK